MSDGSRQAALLLHAMTPPDRDWLLGRLPASERESLQKMLAELASLGIVPESDLLRQATQEARAEQISALNSAALSEVVKQTGRTRDEAVKFLLDSPPSNIAQILRKEPPGLVARFLHAYAWPWQAAMLSQIGAVRQRNIEDALSAIPACPPRLADELIIRIAAVLESSIFSSLSAALSTPERHARTEAKPHSFMAKIFGGGFANRRQGASTLGKRERS